MLHRFAGQEHDAHGHEYHFLSQVVKQNFRPECFQDILLNGGPPAWVAELISDPRGRDLIFQLAASHTNPDPFLAWTIKHIVAAGYDTPVPLARSSLSQPAASKCVLSACVPAALHDHLGQKYTPRARVHRCFVYRSRCACMQRRAKAEQQPALPVTPPPPHHTAGVYSSAQSSTALK